MTTGGGPESGAGSPPTPLHGCGRGQLGNQTDCQVNDPASLEPRHGAVSRKPRDLRHFGYETHSHPKRHLKCLAGLSRKFLLNSR